MRHSLANSIGQETTKAHLQKHIRDGIFRKEDRRAGYEFSKEPKESSTTYAAESRVRCGLERQRTRSEISF